MLLLLLYLMTLGVEGSEVVPRMVTESGIDFKVYMLEERGDTAKIDGGEYDDQNNFCFSGSAPEILKFWASASFKLDLFSDDYEVYIGPNLTTVHYLRSQSEVAWFYSQLPWKTKHYKIDPFKDTCLMIETSDEYRVTLQVLSINYFLFLTTAASVLIFFLAPRLCRNQFFHFTTGISLGVVLSVLILTFLVQRKLRVQWFSWITLLYSLSLYFITSTWYNIKDYMSTQYLPWLVGYLLTSGLVSFAIIYRMGAPTNPRTINLIQWTMQGMSLLGIYFSSYNQLASLALVLVLVVWNMIPGAVRSSANTRFRRTFLKPKVKLLSEEEYISQRNEETRKALDDLRKYCQSPDSKPWQTVTKLSTPGRFAEFIQGSPHITETEVMEYSHWESNDDTDEDSDSRSNLTDDEVGNRSFDGQSDH